MNKCNIKLVSITLAIIVICNCVIYYAGHVQKNILRSIDVDLPDVFNFNSNASHVHLFGTHKEENDTTGAANKSNVPVIDTHKDENNTARTTEKSESADVPVIETHKGGNKTIRSADNDLGEALQKAQSLRIACIIITCPSHHETHVTAIKETWAKRCDYPLFMSSTEDPLLPSIDALGKDNGADTKTNVWNKNKGAFKYAYEHYFDKVDWFLKAEDDTFVVMENLRAFLSQYDTENEAMWFGCNMKKHTPSGYMSGGAGYVLSKLAVKKYVEGMNDKNNKECSHKTRTNDDPSIAICLYKQGVKFMDSSDAEGKFRFNVFEPRVLVTGLVRNHQWFINSTWYPFTVGYNCCSESSITFHYITPNTMRAMEYLIYHLTPFEIPTLLPEKFIQTLSD